MGQATVSQSVAVPVAASQNDFSKLSQRRTSFKPPSGIPQTGRASINLRRNIESRSTKTLAMSSDNQAERVKSR